MAEGGALLRRYTGLNPYRGFESLSLRQLLSCRGIVVEALLLGLVAERAELVDEIDEREDLAIGHRRITAHPCVELARRGFQPPGELFAPEVPDAYA